LGGISHRKDSMTMPSIVAFEEGFSAALVKMELARALRQLLRAIDYREA